MVSRRGLVLGFAGLAGLAVGGTIAGCSSGEDAQAFLPWDGLPSGPDGLLRLVAWASLAPSAHNLQPWRLWRDGEDGLTLLADPSRVSPATDPLFRQLFVSQGTFIELLDLAAAAAGFRIEANYFPDGPLDTLDDLAKRPVAHFRFLPDPDTVPPALFSVVRQRRTTRSPFSGRAIAEETRHALMAEPQKVPGVGMGWLDRGSGMERLTALATEAMRIEMNDPDACRELAGVMRLTAAEVVARRDGLVPVPYALGRVIRFLYGNSAFAEPESILVRSGFSRMAKQAESATAFAWLVTAGNSRADQIAAGRAYMRLDLAATRLGVALQPISQPLEEYQAMTAMRADLHRLLARDGDTVQMLVRLGYASPEKQSPRRPASQFLRG